AAARLNQTNGLRLEFLPQPALPLAHEMLLLPSEELSSLPGQVHSASSSGIWPAPQNGHNRVAIPLSCSALVAALISA
ncbi:hypothetical protein, partial [uncultured Bosea sp.]|uniref:hypothetical protein n=1 Tax=uncultured Bosea sp. TaxID=211457 RepID=UPI00263AF97A